MRCRFWRARRLISAPSSSVSTQFSKKARESFIPSFCNSNAWFTAARYDSLAAASSLSAASLCRLSSPFTTDLLSPPPGGGGSCRWNPALAGHLHLVAVEGDVAPDVLGRPHGLGIVPGRVLDAGPVLLDAQITRVALPGAVRARGALPEEVPVNGPRREVVVAFDDRRVLALGQRDAVECGSRHDSPLRVPYPGIISPPVGPEHPELLAWPDGQRGGHWWGRHRPRGRRGGDAGDGGRSPGRSWPGNLLHGVPLGLRVLPGARAHDARGRHRDLAGLRRDLPRRCRLAHGPRSRLALGTPPPHQAPLRPVRE